MEENKKDVLPLEGEPLTTLQISEPVVNALAAALNKIETYVPTQYINDGPPDIDAEHLNHAEQAIMRVTNLANGAADEISALQSQVTQLNNNFGRLLKPTTETINIDSLNLENGTYVIGSGMSGTKPFEYGILIQFKRYTYTVQIAIDIDSAAIAKRQTNNESWSNWDFYVTKSDLDNNLVEKINGVSNSWTKSITINVDEFGFYMISVVQGGNVKWFGFVRLNGTSEPFLATISGNTSDIVITRSPNNKQMTVASANGENFYIIIIG